jgi:uroporphyrinogen-III synthase
VHFETFLWKKGVLGQRLVEALIERRRAGVQVRVLVDGSGGRKMGREAVRQLREAGATVVEIDAYRESLPVNRRPAHDLVEATCAATLSAVTFTTAPAVHNLFALAAEIGRADDLRDAFNDGVVAACVGPVCAEGALEEGVTSPLVPSRSRLVPMVQTLTEHLASRD